MPLLGSAALLLAFDVEPSAVAEHDRWHTHEHLPERLAIPGFLRGTRWTALDGGPRYLVLYEVRTMATLVSDAYLARLDAPTPWTQRMMPAYRGMTRGLCAVRGSVGPGQGGFASAIRFAAGEGGGQALVRALLDTVLPAVPQVPGLGSAHLLEGAQAAAMTAEQRIRGADRGVDLALIVTGHDRDAVARWTAARCAGDGELVRAGARGIGAATYALAHSLLAAEAAGAATA